MDIPGFVDVLTYNVTELIRIFIFFIYLCNINTIVNYKYKVF